jgi:hypothetical protein
MQLQNKMQPNSPVLPNKRTYRQLQRLLKAVENEVSTLLSQSLHQAVSVHLQKDEPTQPILRNIDIKIAKHPRIPLSDSETLTDVLEKSEGKLLIVGAAGSGKTTLLLELAAQLCEKALVNDSIQVPILLHLTRWLETQVSCVDWILDEIEVNYKIPKKISKNWLEDNYLLLLVDGWDELPPAHQVKWINFLNILLVSPTQKMIVCTRYESYKNCSVKLSFNHAILLKPLNQTQIKDYLLNARSRELWYNIETEPHLLALAGKPLFLSMMTLAYEEILIYSWKRLTQLEELQDYLFNAYIRRQLGRDINPRKYPLPEHSRYWLVFLAKMMDFYQQLDFSVDQITPDWLQTKAQQRCYKIGVFLLGGWIPGLGFIRQFVLRYVLWKSGYIPWNYTRFLNYATAQLLLKKSGNYYRFIHALLQQHFAQMSIE